MSGGAAFALLLLCTLLVVNVRATRRVAGSGEEPFRRNLFIAGIWIVPFFGALAVKDVGRARRLPDVSEDTMRPTEPAPAHIALSAGRVLEANDALVLVHGVPHLDWDRIQRESSEALTAQDRSALRTAWLLHLRDALGDHYRLHPSEHAVCLASLDDVEARALLACVATTRKKILRVLQDVATFEPGEQSTVLVLDDEETYYHYISTCHGGSGEFGFSSGMFIGSACPHFVVKRSDLRAIEPVIAHELTHSALAHLELPLWLDEGLAVNTEHRLAGATPQQYTAQQLHGKHVAFWDAGRIQEFWSGQSFRRTDDGQMLSYELARILVQEMARDWPSFSAFVQSAERQDAGDAAAREVLGIDLGVSVCALFGKDASESWAPDGAAWQAAAADAQEEAAP